MSSLSGKCHLPVNVGLAYLACASCLAAEEPTHLRERFPVGYEYHVSSRVDLSGTLMLPSSAPAGDKGAARPAPTPLSVRGTSAIEYDERVLDIGKDNQVVKTVRLCRRTDFRRSVGGRPQENSLRPEVRRLILLRHQNKEVPFLAECDRCKPEIQNRNVAEQAGRIIHSGRKQ